jgi:hypothetical protein
MRLMQLRLALVPLLLGACLTTPADDVAPIDDVGTAAAEVAVEIGVCGANRDPRTGVTCTYRPGGPLDGPNYTGSEVIVGGDGLDYLQCVYAVSCWTRATASNDGAACASVLGTGCDDGSMTTSMTRKLLLPAGAPAPTPAQAAAMCVISDDERGLLLWGIIACERAAPIVVEQGEDLCCVDRAPIPVRPPIIVEPRPTGAP